MYVGPKRTSTELADQRRHVGRFKYGIGFLGTVTSHTVSISILIASDQRTTAACFSSYQVSSSPAEQKTITKHAPSCAISDAQLRASVCTNNGAKPPERTTRKATPCTAPNKTAARNSADNVTAAYTLLQEASAQRNTSRSTKTEAGRRATPQARALSASRGNIPQQCQREEQQQAHREGRSRRQHPSSSLSHDWRTTNIGFNNIKSEARARTERENREGYERAAFASCAADKPYIAEATHFRFRYPHTLGRIQALSRVRSDRAEARRDQARASFTRNPKSSRES